MVDDRAGRADRVIAVLGSPLDCFAQQITLVRCAVRVVGVPVIVLVESQMDGSFASTGRVVPGRGEHAGIEPIAIFAADVADLADLPQGSRELLAERVDTVSELGLVFVLHAAQVDVRCSSRHVGESVEAARLVDRFADATFVRAVVGHVRVDMRSALGGRLVWVEPLDLLAWRLLLRVAAVAFTEPAAFVARVLALVPVSRCHDGRRALLAVRTRAERLPERCPLISIACPPGRGRHRGVPAHRDQRAVMVGVEHADLTHDDLDRRLGRLRIDRLGHVRAHRYDLEPAADDDVVVALLP